MIDKIIQFIAWCVRPLYMIHNEAKHGAKSTGALLYIRDVNALQKEIVGVCGQLSAETRRNLSVEVKESMEKLVESEQKRIEEWCLNTIEEKLNGKAENE